MSLYSYTNKARKGAKRKRGGETFGQKIWWNHMRPIHSFMFALFAYLAISKNKNSYIVLFAQFGRKMGREALE